jgi:hypothetical protein
MPLGTGQPLSGSAIVANENFFSHAKEVLRGRAVLPSLVFAVGKRLSAGRRKKSRLRGLVARRG